MKNSTVHSFLGLAHTAGNAVLELIAAFMRWLPGASVGRVLFVCILLALIVHALPLVLVLFVAFMVLKVILGDQDRQPGKAGEPTRDPSVDRDAGDHTVN